MLDQLPPAAAALTGAAVLGYAGLRAALTDTATGLSLPRLRRDELDQLVKLGPSRLTSLELYANPDRATLGGRGWAPLTSREDARLGREEATS